ncbi:hypothetical protein [Actinokineospora fastidiosa]|uniref:NlpC/P60 domain-containing protein n=1 Tax=Actinokineospora fastidiosa TaxID=1816 RepID=A0A918GN20_9PSEU|nr:hypothetical protein [Actinokineospora fastidiosa]GGS46370.1 hypothetical protein GCM10010171_46970 [Actinokineospora fastidiosa]
MTGIGSARDGRRSGRWFALVAVFVALVVGASMVVAAPPASAAEPRGNRISRAEIISRAQDWWQRQIPYSMTGAATDVQGVSYRTDCSGFISMAWRLPTSRTTDTLDDVSTKLGSVRDLQPGDILMWDGPGNEGHVVLFQKWEDKAAGKFWLYEQSGTADDMRHRVADLDDYPQPKWSAYKYGDGDGDFDARYESFTEVDGTEFTDFSTSSTYCNTSDLPLFRLTGFRNVEARIYSCARYESSDNTIRGWMAVKWWPYAGTDDDSTDTVGTKFDGFGLHPQLQVGTVTRREAVCWMGGDINAAASGLRGCYFAMPATSGDWSLDGWVNWDENNDGEPPFGPRYTYGSPIINR